MQNQQREMDEYIMSQNQGRLDFGLNNSYMKSGSSHITQSLKNHVKELKADLKKKDEEINKIKKSLKSTNIQELEVEMKLYVDECTRLRHMLEEAYKNVMDPNEMAKLQEQFQIQDNYLVNLQGENQELAETCAKMQQIMQSQQEEKKSESKLKSKLNRILTNKKKLSKNLKFKEREIHQLKRELTEARMISKGGSSNAKSLNDKVTKLQRDVDEKNRNIQKLKRDNTDKDAVIRQLQDQVAHFMASAGAGGNTKSETTEQVVRQEFSQPQVSAPIQQQEEQYSEEEEERHEQTYGDDEDQSDDYEDDQDLESSQPQESPKAVEEPTGGVSDHEEEVRGEQKPIISESDVDPLFDKLKLCLQRNKIKYQNMGQALPSEVTVMQLEHKLKTLGMKDPEERLTLSRYIVEPRSEKMIEFIEDREISKEKAENVLKTKIDEYDTYEFNGEEMKRRIRDKIGKFKGTLQDTFEFEDLDSTGYIPAKALKTSLDTMEILLDDDLLEYLVFISGVTDKIGKNHQLMLEYSKIIDMANESAEEPDVEKDAEQLLNEAQDDQDYSDEYGNDFEDNEKQDEEPQETEPQYTEPKITEEQAPPAEGEDDDLDQEIDDEEMINIAENCLIKIAEELLNKNITVRQLYKDDIIDEEIEGEKIELLLPVSFLEGLKRLDINDFSELEIACLMNVLAKPQLENTILLDELIDIMENLGIPDDDMSGTASPPQNKQTNETPDAPSQQQNEKKKKGLDVSGLSEDAKTLLLNFLVYLEQESITPANFFQDVKYEQMVKTKKKQSAVDIVNAEDFFKLMEDNYEISGDVNLTDSVKNELQSLL